jgi:hypothetical protein
MTVDGKEYATGNKALSKLATVFGFTTIEFYSMELPVLETIAKYRLLPVPTLLVLHKSKVVARIVGDELPTPARLSALINVVEITN